MNIMQQTVTISENRRLSLDVVIPDHMPTGDMELLLVFSPIQKKEDTHKNCLSSFAGALAHSEAFSGDAVELQRACRDEW